MMHITAIFLRFCSKKSMPMPFYPQIYPIDCFLLPLHFSFFTILDILRTFSSFFSHAPVFSLPLATRLSALSLLHDAFFRSKVRFWSSFMQQDFYRISTLRETAISLALYTASRSLQGHTVSRSWQGHTVSHSLQWHTASCTALQMV